MITSEAMMSFEVKTSSEVKMSSEAMMSFKAIISSRLMIFPETDKVRTPAVTPGRSFRKSPRT